MVSRTRGLAETGETASSTSGVRIRPVTSRPSRRTRWASPSAAKLDARVVRHARHRVGILGVDARVEAGEGDRAIHRPRVEVGEAAPPRDLARDR